MSAPAPYAETDKLFGSRVSFQLSSSHIPILIVHNRVDYLQRYAVVNLSLARLFSELLAQLGGPIDHLVNQSEAMDDGGYRSIG